MTKEKLSLLSHLDPRRDVEHALAQGRSGVILVAQRNFVRGAVVGALAGAGLDHLLLDGGIDMALLFGVNTAVADSIQGLGRGTIEIAKRMYGK